jgi:hypothetical protein
MATELGDLGLDVLASVRLGQAYFNLGEYQRALEILGLQRNLWVIISGSALCAERV